MNKLKLSTLIRLKEETECKDISIRSIFDHPSPNTVDKDRIELEFIFVHTNGLRFCILRIVKVELLNTEHGIKFLFNTIVKQKREFLKVYNQ